MAITMPTLDLEIAEMEVVLDEVETRRLDFPVNVTAERITLRQTLKELETRLAALRRLN